MTDAMTTQKPKKQKTPSPFPFELIDQLLAQVANKAAESIFGEAGLAGRLRRALAERMLQAELSHHLAVEGEASKNHRNGSSPKKVLTLEFNVVILWRHTSFPSIMVCIGVRPQHILP